MNASVSAHAVTCSIIAAAIARNGRRVPRAAPGQRTAPAAVSGSRSAWSGSVNRILLTSMSVFCFLRLWR